MHATKNPKVSNLIQPLDTPVKATRKKTPVPSCFTEAALNLKPIVTLKMTGAKPLRYRPVTPKEDGGLQRGPTKGGPVKQEGNQYGLGPQASLCVTLRNVRAAVS